MPPKMIPSIIAIIEVAWCLYILLFKNIIDRMYVIISIAHLSIYVTLVAISIRVIFLRDVSIKSQKDGIKRRNTFSFF